jgi:hypothetical protein
MLAIYRQRKKEQVLGAPAPAPRRYQQRNCYETKIDFSNEVSIPAAATPLQISTTGITFAGLLTPENFYTSFANLRTRGYEIDFERQNDSSIVTSTAIVDQHMSDYRCCKCLITSRLHPYSISSVAKFKDHKSEIFPTIELVYPGKIATERLAFVLKRSV